jgi:hypothetical protein
MGVAHGLTEPHRILGCVGRPLHHAQGKRIIVRDLTRQRQRFCFELRPRDDLIHEP